MSDAVTLASCVRIPKGVLAHLLGDELVLLNLETGIYFSLNPVGTRIWQLIQIHPSRSLQEILDILTEEYSVEMHRCRKDLFQLITRLQENRLLEMSH